jgi:glycosyltransferase involved in cell wall biosynthesis
MLSLIVPIYKSAANIPALMEALVRLHAELAGAVEMILVVDGSPDESYLLLRDELPRQPFHSTLLALSRNFGSFAAIRAGLAVARGERMAVMAADLQEPPELIVEFDRLLRAGDVDVVVGQRAGRADPLVSRAFSRVFWGVYRRLVQREIPAGGIDIFACTAKVNRELIRLDEANSSLVGLLFWVGFRRRLVPYVRRRREIGRSAWTFAKKLRYLSDSVFAFSDLPVRLLMIIGILGLATSTIYASIVVGLKLLYSIPVPGYAATIVLVAFFGGLNCFGLGLLGGYLWRTFENSKGRPSYIVMSTESFNDDPVAGGPGARQGLGRSRDE